MNPSQWPNKVQPAQLAFIAIYNPTLGPTDETFKDQLVFWYSRAAQEARAAARKNGRKDAAGGDAIREEENEKLRRIGLAQGMLDFARSFSNDAPVDTIETEKSRIVLHELESGWWILASIDLTRLPTMTDGASEASKKAPLKAQAQANVEYSSREVSPGQLLVQQLIQAHKVFKLHHGPCLDELWVRLGRDKLSNALDRFWTRFAKTWNVLLHGNPAVDIFGGIKLASGGELGIGVGEEEWGSAERAVLEDLTRRTEGLLDLVVSRFGEPASAVASDTTSLPEFDSLPWLGNGSQPAATDGIIFGGVGAIGRQSLCDLSQWMRQIYTDGANAYGVKDNPLRERRKRRRHHPPESSHLRNEHDGNERGQQGTEAEDPRHDGQKMANAHALEPDPSATANGNIVSTSQEDAQSHHQEGQLIENGPAELAEHVGERPAIPPPIVVATETTVKKATAKADNDRRKAERLEDSASSDTTLGVPNAYMKYLTFGLSELAKPSKPKHPPSTSQTSTLSEQSIRPGKGASQGKTVSSKSEDHNDPNGGSLTRLDPIPDGERVEAKLARQRHLENQGHFVIGLTGDLNNVPDSAEADETDDGPDDDSGGPRTVVRTLQVELLSIDKAPPEASDEANSRLEEALDEQEKHTQNMNKLQRVRVVVYVHRPFIYCLLFDTQTSSLQYSSFYKDLHRTLAPIHKSLLSSTSVAKVAQRIESSHIDATNDAATTTSSQSNRLPAKGGKVANDARPIFDLLYDPILTTVHTSIPNIPDPGTPAAEGLSNSSALPAGWTRIDALNVHSQILNTLQSVKSRPEHLEKTSKTSRGWWIAWLKVPPSKPPAASVADEAGRALPPDQPDADVDETASTTSLQATPTPTPTSTAPAAVDATPSAEADNETQDMSRKFFAPSSIMQPEKEMHRIAFLVRKSSDANPAYNKSSSSSTMTSASSSGIWAGFTLRPSSGAEERAVSAAGGGGLGNGMGVDARKYVEGLLSLNR